MGAFNALERLITSYRGGYTWLLGPYDDVAPLFDDYLRSTCLDEPTCASHVDFSTWTTHTCEIDIIIWEFVSACLDHSLV
jgi:hypothetical protein